MSTSAMEMLWEQTRGSKVPTEEEWGLQMHALYAAGKGLHETLDFLYHTKPTLQDFIDWAGAVPQQVHSTAEDVLTKDDLDFFQINGYIVFKNAVPPQACANGRTAITTHLGIDITDPETWYELHSKNHGLMVPLYQHPALEVNRYSARIRKAFEQLYGSTTIYPVVEKVSFNPPETSAYHFAGSPLHWDASLAQPIPFKLQGLVYLSDCDATGGAFHCVPGLHNNIGKWLAELPENTDPRKQALEELLPVAVPGKAGDLVIWHQALPHCATANKAAAPRFVQYITYDPEGYKGQEEWI